MVRENIRFQEGNFANDGIYYYSILDGSQVLQQKVDDGSVAFSFPLDTTTGNVDELKWDGVYFWSLEDRSGGTGSRIRKWGISQFICKQQQVFEFIDGPVHTYDSDSFALEYYALTVGVNDNGAGGYTKNLQDIHVSDNSMLEPGDVLTFVRRGTSAAQRVGTQFVEQATVQSTISGSNTQVRLTAAMQGDPHSDNKGFRGPNIDIDLLGGNHPPTPDLVYVTKNIWLANDNSPSAPGTPALYKIRASNGSNLIQFSGTQFTNIDGMAFYAKYSVGLGLDNPVGTPPIGNTPYNIAVANEGVNGGRQTYVLLARGTSLLFFNTSTNVIDRSMVMNNIKVDTINHWPVFDMLVGGLEPNIVLYRLQLGTTYRNTSLVLVDETWATFNYEKQLLRRVINSIAITIDPSIIPADGGSIANVTAVLRDQYNNTVPAGRLVNWSDDSGGAGGGSAQGIASTQTSTDAFGATRNTYRSGTVEKDVKITASVTNGLLP